jgi:stage V sporulation protein T
MGSISVVRKIDELGRIVLPKEVRKKLKIRTNDFVEIFIDNDLLCLKKYSKISSLKNFAQNLTDMLYSYTHKDILIADKYNIIAYSGKNKKKYLTKEISDQILESINRRESIMQNHVKELKLINDEIIKCSYVMDTIISNSEYIGIVVMYSEEDILSEHDMNVIKILSSFLNKYLED